MSGSAARGGAEEPADKDPTVSVLLVLKDVEYDPNPGKPSESVLKCVVRNGTLEPILVPAGFDGKQVELHSRRMTLFRRPPRRVKGEPQKAEEPVKMVRLEPGQEQEIFELPLDRILLKEEKFREEWGWKWERRPEPPRSPVHRWREPGFNPQAVFQVKVAIAGETLKSNTVTLKVTADDPVE